jgi:hypothetical protein
VQQIVFAQTDSAKKEGPLMRSFFYCQLYKAHVLIPCGVTISKRSIPTVLLEGNNMTDLQITIRAFKTVTGNTEEYVQAVWRVGKTTFGHNLMLYRLSTEQIAKTRRVIRLDLN